MKGDDPGKASLNQPKMTAEQKHSSKQAGGPPARNSSRAAPLPTREEVRAWIEQDEEPGGGYDPDLETIVDQVLEGLQQSHSGVGLRSVDELLAELRALAATDADEG